MSARPWYKRFPADFIAGTLSLSLEEKGAYSVLLDLIYDRGGPIPDDPQWIARVCGCSTRKWKKIRETLLSAGKIHAKDGLLSNVRAEKQIENGAKEARKLAENGAKGAEKTNEKQTSFKENSKLEEKGPLKTERHTRSQKPDTRKDISPLKSPPLASKKGTRLSETWTLPFEWREWAALERPDVDVDLEGEKFRDYWIAKAGKAAVKRDWQATWRNWIRNGYAAKRTDSNALNAGLYAAAVAGETPDHGHGAGEPGHGTGRASRRSALFGDSWARNAESGVGGSAGDIRAPLKLVAD